MGVVMVDVNAVTKDYRMGKIMVPALRGGINLTIASGEMVAIMGGPSGSGGKSTLMNILGCLDRPTAGTYKLHKEEVSEKSDSQLARLENRKVGFIFQSFNLLEQLTALEMLSFPLFTGGVWVPVPDEIGQICLSTAWSRGPVASPPTRAFRWSAAARGHCPSRSGPTGIGFGR